MSNSWHILVAIFVAMLTTILNLSIQLMHFLGEDWITFSGFLCPIIRTHGIRSCPIPYVSALFWSLQISNIPSWCWYITFQRSARYFLWKLEMFFIFKCIIWVMYIISEYFSAYIPFHCEGIWMWSHLWGCSLTWSDCHVNCGISRTWPVFST